MGIILPKFLWQVKDFIQKKIWMENPAGEKWKTRYSVLKTGPRDSVGALYFWSTKSDLLASVVCRIWEQIPAWRIIPGGSPPFISHEVRPFGRGPTTRSLGDLLSN